MPLACRPCQENTREPYDRLSAKCFDSKGQNQKKYKKSTQDRKEENVEDEAEKESHKSSEDEAVEGSSSNTDCDQDSDVSFVNDTDEEIDTAEIEQEEWIEYIKRSTAEAEESQNPVQD